MPDCNRLEVLWHDGPTYMDMLGSSSVLSPCSWLFGTPTMVLSWHWTVKKTAEHQHRNSGDFLLLVSRQHQVCLLYLCHNTRATGRITLVSSRLSSFLVPLVLQSKPTIEIQPSWHPQDGKYIPVSLKFEDFLSFFKKKHIYI